MTKLIALTGPPCAGKSTVCTFFEDMGVPVIGTGDGVRQRAETLYDDPDEDQIWETAQALRDEHGPAGPTIACEDLIKRAVTFEEEPIVVVSGLREQAEVDWLSDEFTDPLVVRVDTSTRGDRERRYVEREVSNLHEHEPVPMDRERELREELRERERREEPYPRHHVTLLNDDSIRMEEIMCRVAGICRFVDPDGAYDGPTMDGDVDG